MPTLAVVNFNIVCATLGGFITVFGLISYLLKERYYLSEALIATLAGVIFGPHAANFIRPLDYAGSAENLETITLYFTRLVLGVQLVIAGVQLPSMYLKHEWKSLSLLLGPGMCLMWISTSILVFLLVPNITFIMALTVGATMTPTDPVLSSSIVKGRWADKNIPPGLQKIIVAESGANDGLGYPFLFLGLYLLKYTTNGAANPGEAMAMWFGETWAYTIILSVLYGGVVGWIAKELLHWAEDRHYVDRESFLVFAITLALFIIGTVGMIGSDDVLACFIAGNSFTSDDWFRIETMDDSLQPTIDMLLNVTVFVYFGAVCPWHKFLDNSVVPLPRLIGLGILILLLRRIPMVLAFHKYIHQIENFRNAIFVGFFGPIGVSAIFYLYISRQFLRDMVNAGQATTDAAHLAEVLELVVWFLTICSIFVHGLSIPVGKLGIYLPRTLSTAISTGSPTSPLSEHDRSRLPSRGNRWTGLRSFRRRPTTSELGPASPLPFLPHPRWILRLFHNVSASIGLSKTPARISTANAKAAESEAQKSSSLVISGPSDARPIGRVIQSPQLPPESIELRSIPRVDPPSLMHIHTTATTPPLSSITRTPGIHFADELERNKEKTTMD